MNTTDQAQHADSAPIRISGPTDLIALVPYLLGFTPAESVVLVDLAARRIAITARTDLAAGEPALTAAMAVVKECDDLLLVAYTEHQLPHWLQPLPACRDALVITAGRWRSLTCADPRCCPPTGAPLPDLVPAVVPATIATGNAPMRPASTSSPHSGPAPRPARPAPRPPNCLPPAPATGPGSASSSCTTAATTCTPPPRPTWTSPGTENKTTGPPAPGSSTPEPAGASATGCVPAPRLSTSTPSTPPTPRPTSSTPRCETRSTPHRCPRCTAPPDAPGQGVAPYQVTWTRLSGQMGYADSHAKRAPIRAADSRYPSARAMSSLRPSARTPIITSRHSLCSSSRMLTWMPSAHT
jgi:Domain of unknown function (DUF4192)